MPTSAELSVAVAGLTTKSPDGHDGSSLFYANTRNPNIHITGGRPLRPNSYILISAGYDGEYGTRDDIFNFSGNPINIKELDGYISQLPN